MRKICREAVSQGHVWDFDTVLEVLSGKNAMLFYLANDQGDDWDGYVLVHHAVGVCELFFIYVALSARRHGMATQLLDSVKSMLEQTGQQVDFFLEVRTDNVGAQALYQNFGFSKTGMRKHYYRDGTDALTYKMTVDGRTA